MKAKLLPVWGALQKFMPKPCSFSLDIDYLPVLSWATFFSQFLNIIAIQMGAFLHAIKPLLKTPLKILIFEGFQSFMVLVILWNKRTQEINFKSPNVETRFLHPKIFMPCFFNCWRFNPKGLLHDGICRFSIFVSHGFHFRRICFAFAGIGRPSRKSSSWLKYSRLNFRNQLSPSA